MKTKKHWYDYLWIASTLYLLLGFINILFAWLGLLCFFIPLIISIVKGNKAYCNKYCGRGKLFNLLGNKLGLSIKRECPTILRRQWFRYSFLIFFLTMFGNMIFVTYMVFGGSRELVNVVKLLWTINFPWNFSYNNSISPWIAQFAFGFYSVMLTSTVLGIITMIFFKPRTWCVYCPMGTMTQAICKVKNHGKE
ncbi:UNVERIFIED_CONTAM: 4Fe-4S binding protein [Acetivibrio alkalicellulosi]